MRCPSCGSENIAGSTFCAVCGLPLPAQPVTAQQPAPPPYAPPAAPPAYAPVPPAPPAPAPGYTGAPPQGVPGYAPPVAPGYPPGYAAPPSTPMYPPGYAAPPSMPMYPPQGYPQQPMYPQPGYAAPPSTPMYPPQGYPPQYATQGTAAGAGVGSALSRFFGADAIPGTVQPATPLQGLLYRSISPAMAVNRWFTAAMGAVVALVAGLILTALSQSLWTNSISGLVGSIPGVGSLGGAAGNLSTPPLLMLFALEQRAPLTISGGAGGGDLASASLSLPLTGLFLLPALALVIGGYISAASDYAHSARFAIARGALIGPMYAVLLGVLGLFSSSTISAEGVSVTIGVSPLWEGFYGLVWGLLFGAIGGWIAYSGWSFLEWAMPVFHRLNPTPRRWAAALAGGGVAYVTGSLLAGALLTAMAGALGVYTSAALPVASFSALNAFTGSQSSAGSAGAHGVALVLILIFVIAPVAAQWVFALASGVSLDTTSSVQGASSSSVSLFGVTSNGVTTHPAIPAWVFLVMLIPLIAWVAGGITAARAAQARTPGDGFVAGALAGVPFAIIFAISAALSGLSFDAQALGTTVSGGFGPSFISALFITLIGSAVVGGASGALSISMPWLGALPLWAAAPFRVLQPVLYPLLDRLTGHRGGPRSAARQWLYVAVLLTLFAVVVLVALDFLGGLLMRAMPYPSAINLMAGLTALVIFLPLAYLTGALVTAFTAPLGAPVAPVPAMATAPGFPPPAMAPAPVGEPPAAPQYAPQYGPPLTPPAPPPPAPGYTPPPPSGPPTAWPS